MFQQLRDYFAQNLDTYLKSVWQHLELSGSALLIALIIGLPLGYLGYKYKAARLLTTGVTQALRVIPSLGILFFLIPFVGVGKFPALIALVILAVPPILINTILGFSEVSTALLETGLGLGMSESQLFTKVTFPLALPHILNGIKLALIEVIASATLATYIGAGGLGSLIFTGLGLYRMDLLLIGGGSVALLSFISMLGFDLFIRRIKYED
ncbi:ABC transporter permease [Streptococcus minor]|uniref:ABC transporter permease n=1 Tax=Streptococcus minor TaxID=229549 RepID=UPI0003709679|nr:ABC transporter permease [Streptococcus minor]